MTDTVESLTEQVKTLKANKASAAEIKAANEKLIALKKAAGQAAAAKKKAETKDDDEEGGTPAPKAAEPAKTEPAKETPKAEPAAKAEPAKPAAEKGKKAGAKAEPKKEEGAKLEPPKEAERKKSEKSEPRKKSEKVEETPKEPEKKAEAAPAAAAGGEDTVESLTAKVAALKLAKASAADIKAANEQLIALRKAQGQARKKSEKAAADDDEEGAATPATPAKAAEVATKAMEKAAEAASTTEKPAEAKAAGKKGGKGAAEPKEAAKGEAAKADAPAADAGKKEEAGKKAKKPSERKQSTKEEPAKVPAAEAKPVETKPEEVKIHTGGKKKKILAISGSLRKDSFNTALLKAAQKLAPEGIEITIADISGLPFFNQDTEYEANPTVAAFKKAIEEADAILFSTPEYNYSMPGVLKNAIDVASRPWGQNSWANKPTGILSVSVGGLGGVRAQLALRQSAVFLKLCIFPGDEFFVSDANNKFDANGPAAAVNEKLTAWLAAFSQWLQTRS